MCFRSDIGISTGGRKREYRVIGIVEGVNDVVRGAWMIWVFLVDVECDCTCFGLQAITF